MRAYPNEADEIKKTRTNNTREARKDKRKKKLTSIHGIK